MHQRGVDVEANSERRITGRSQVQVQEKSSSQFLIRSRYRQDCVRRQEAQHEGVGDVEIEMSPQF